MRILQVTQSYYPFLERGGPAVKVRAMARGLARRGHSVTVLTADLGLQRDTRTNGYERDRWGWRSRQNERAGATAQGSLETIYLTSRGGYRALTWNPTLFAYCRECVPQFDVVHIFGFYDLLGPAAARACRRFGVPYVLEPMGMFRPIVRNIPLKRVYRRLLGDSMALRASRVIATSEQEERELIEQGVPANRVLIRRNGIEVPDGLPPRGLFRQSRKIPNDAKVILFLGRLVTKKSPELLLDAFAAWQAKATSSNSPKQNAVLVFAGPTESRGYQAELEARVQRLSLDRQVLFTGPLYDDAKWSAYRDADLFVLPSQNENFGNTAAEAVVCGTPVLVTETCGIAPLVASPTGVRAGIAVPHDRDALTASLSRLLSDRDLLEELSQGCAAVAQTLDWRQPLDETEALYAALAPKPTLS